MKTITTYLKSKQLALAAAMLMVASFSWAQVTGTVTDENGDGLAGATVRVEGGSAGAITGVDGEYSVDASSSDNLVYSFVGYSTQTIAVDGRSTIDVQLLEDVSTLEQVVVIGYGEVRKKDLTGSVASVGAKDFNQGANTAPDQLIQGKVAGVLMINDNGQPGGETTFRIRGTSSFRAGNQPLFVIDGVPLDGGSAKPGADTGDLGGTPGSNPLNFINPNDIASIDVLKDASATAIYGSRGANGVVIITTKKGRAGAPKFEAGVQAGTASLFRDIEVLDAAGYRNALDLYGITSGDLGGSTDAMDAITRNGITQNYNFGISGGSDKGNFRISASMLDQEGIIKESGLKKYTGSINANYSFLDNDRLKVAFNLLGAQNATETAPISDNAGFTGSLIGNALQWNPTAPLIQPDGSFTRLSAATINPLELLSAYNDNDKVTTILGSISPSFDIISDKLTYKYLFSLNNEEGTREAQIRSTLNLQGTEGLGRAGVATARDLTLQHTHTLNFQDQITDDVYLNVLGGYEFQDFQSSGTFLGGVGFPPAADDLGLSYISFIGTSDPNRNAVGAGTAPPVQLQSYFTRANINFKDKYLLTATMRADGSTKFGENNKYGYFPSLAAAWNIDQEDFFSSQAFDNLKLRLGWGQTGNQEFAALAAKDQFGLGQDGSVTQFQAANPDLTWETSTTFNAGIDFSVLEYRLRGTVDYFNKETNDFIFSRNIALGPPAQTFLNLPGVVKNSGVELSLDGLVIDKQDLSLNIATNLSFLQNDVSDFDPNQILQTGALTGQGSTGAFVQRIQNGQPINAFYLRQFQGINQTTGQSDLLDGGNTFIFVGDPNPDVLLGFSTNLNVKDFDFNMNYTGAFGHQLFNETQQSVIPIGNLGTRNVASDLIVPGNLEAVSNSNTPSDRYLEDGDYLKLQNATLGYNLGSVGNQIENIRVSLTGQNLFVLTGYTGFDPEVNTNKQANGIPSVGIEYIPYPRSRNFLLGANISF